MTFFCEWVATRLKKSHADIGPICSQHSIPWRDLKHTKMTLKTKGAKLCRAALKCAYRSAEVLRVGISK